MRWDVYVLTQPVGLRGRKRQRHDRTAALRSAVRLSAAQNGMMQRKQGCQIVCSSHAPAGAVVLHPVPNNGEDIALHTPAAGGLLALVGQRRLPSCSLVVREELIRYSPLLANKTVLCCDIEKASWIKNLKTNELVILVDDFVDSGETAVSAVNWLTDSFGTDPKQIVILSIAALEMGIDHVRQKTEVEVYAYYIFRKGISDYYSDDQRDGCLKTMAGIEDKLKVDSDFRLGYAQSEALISLIRTPNNTFPVFWKKKDKSSPAPFLRD